MKSSIALIICATVCLPLSASTIVVPPGLDSVEGDERTLTINNPSGGRVQEVYPVSDFVAVSPGLDRIISMRMRPDQTAPSPHRFTAETYELRLSSTDASPGAISSTFADNTGDDVIVVYRGPIDWQTEGDGVPRSFDYAVEFTEPFFFDVTGGKNLLVDEIFTNTAGSPIEDSQMFDDGTRRLISIFSTATSAGFEFSEAAVRQFEFVPEPCSGTLAVFLAVGLAFARRRLTDHDFETRRPDGFGLLVFYNVLSVDGDTSGRGRFDPEACRPV